VPGALAEQGIATEGTANHSHDNGDKNDHAPRDDFYQSMNFPDGNVPKTGAFSIQSFEPPIYE
jgi:hypothetical protein